MLIDILTRSMYDMKQAINSSTATFRRVGIFSAKKIGNNFELEDDHRLPKRFILNTYFIAKRIRNHSFNNFCAHWRRAVSWIFINVQTHDEWWSFIHTARLRSEVLSNRYLLRWWFWLRLSAKFAVLWHDRDTQLLQTTDYERLFAFILTSTYVWPMIVQKKITCTLLFR